METEELTRTHVLIPHELLEKVDKLVGQRRRSQFLTEALREKLSRIQLGEAARQAAGSLANVEIPGWETSAAAADWVRALRRRDDERMRRMQERR